MGSDGHAPKAGAAARSHVGLVRETNEDTVCVAGEGRLLACADGLGGLPFGEVASRIAVARLVDELEPRVARRSAGRGGWSRRLRHAFLAAHEAVVAASHERGAEGGIATTLIVAVITARRAHVCHVGDVRGYRWRRGALRRLTDDHSVVFDAVRSGALTVEQARLHPRRNLVTQAVGLPDGIAPSTTTVPIAPGDVLMLCSDGLWETMSEAEMEASLHVERDPDAIAESLIQRALAAGGPDNASLVVYRHGAA
jgi:serine/threonine protein phosphatase PrpC